MVQWTYTPPPPAKGGSRHGAKAGGGASGAGQPGTEPAMVEGSLALKYGGGKEGPVVALRAELPEDKMRWLEK